jgi:hypothetical protein
MKNTIQRHLATLEGLAEHLALVTPLAPAFLWVCRTVRVAAREMKSPAPIIETSVFRNNPE